MEKEKSKRVYSILFLICLVLLFTSIPFSMFINNSLVVFIIINSIRFLSIFYIFYYTKKENLHKLELNKPKIKHLIYLPLVIFCCSNIIEALITNTTKVNEINVLNIIYGLISAILIAVIEELLFRGQLFKELKDQHGRLKGILLSSLFFGAIHLLNISSLNTILICLVQSVYTFALGIILCVLYEKTKNIIIPIIFHFLFNFINNTLSTSLFNIKWDIYFYLINIIIGLITLTYLVVIEKFKFGGEIDVR